ncbi:signal transduction histidine kinase [Nonomuraea fuscirosea]|uniref:histidine kinase n=1 Tax=Nonomuraea fuscirosea TaxID=1291556 RepID=A0A2T0M216_9ACTN|nr:signal transduction histidine kinase [Nonomuraea fuscirosea]
MPPRVSLTTVRLRSLPEWQQDVAVTVSSVAIGVLLLVIGWFPLFETGLTAPPWLHPILFGCICVVELFRRRAPIAALTVGFALLAADGVFGASMAALIVFADLLYAATLYGPRQLSRNMVPITSAITIASVGVMTVLTPNIRTAIVTGLAVLPFFVIPMWWATNIRQHKEIAGAERRSAIQLTRIGELGQRAAVAAERAKMARDLHDVIAGHLSAIALQSEAALSLGNASPEAARSVLTSVRENSVRALEEMRAMIELLRADGSGRDETVAPAGLSELSALVDSARASGMAIEVRSDIDESFTLPAAVNLTAYRIAQEALTNAMKHAPQARARVEIRLLDGSLTVEVVNDLPAASRRGDGTGTGLLNMRERATAVGGSLAAGPSGAGWQVRAVLPLLQARP